MEVYTHNVKYYYKPLTFQGSLILQLMTMLAMCFQACQLFLQIISSLRKKKGLNLFFF